MDFKDILLFLILVTLLTYTFIPWEYKKGKFSKPSVKTIGYWWLFFAIPLLMIPLFVKFGLYRAVLQYMGIKVITTTFQATTIACLIIGFLMMFFRESNLEFSLPRSILPIF